MEADINGKKCWLRYARNSVLVMDMGNDETDDLSGAFRQGFLCPFCMQDLGDLTTLHAHVEKYHPKSIPADHSLDHIKGIFDKAKQKISHIDASFLIGYANSNNGGSAPISRSVYNFANNRVEKLSHAAHSFTSLQDLGITRSHTDFYLKCRSPCINDAAVKTNGLIIRLDKLINQRPSDSSKRKAFERETVPWVTDCDVLRCRTCCMKFSLTKRRHHCRLCGEIICRACSQFLSFVDARKLTNPAFAAQLLEELSSSETNIPEKPLSHLSPSMSVAEAIKQTISSESLQSVRLKGEKLFSSTLSLVKRDGTEVSLASLLQQDENEHLRICAECKVLLDVRNEKMEMLTSPPMLVVLYERLCSLIRDGQKLASSYERISKSLSRGETMYTLDSAIQLRNRLIQLQKEIDSISSRVETHHVTEGNTSERCTPQEQVIRKNIRDFSLQMLQQLVMQMNLHPSEDRYNELQEKRRADIRHRVDMERKRNAFILKPSTSNPGFGSFLSETEMVRQNSKNRLKESVSFSGIVTSCEDYGWTPSRIFLHTNPFIEEEDKADPLQEQILIIKGYLKQAVEDSRLEEIEILERNLCDLEREIEKLNKNTSSMQ
ncbi:FYVE zinc finger family protein [Loa loa]|uniref:FYVE zinc finger family protein n=1 Tax=Loa loa TaxID=7209 RepID=A0A1I7VVQ8_LOALO|nr:FYVE zinc finger family protein [Loa loa]EFO26560.1 FYVE zinc finger family protein [Loa loa]